MPLFYPSVALLTKWELGAAVMSERIYWRYASSPPRQPFTPNPIPNPNPNPSQVRLVAAAPALHAQPYPQPEPQP